jgi:hypothetical protein
MPARKAMDSRMRAKIMFMRLGVPPRFRCSAQGDDRVFMIPLFAEIRESGGGWVES